MGTCKAQGRVKNKPYARKIKVLSFRSPNKPNKHRMVPAILRGFHTNSLQMRNGVPGITKRYQIDKNGTVINLKEEINDE